MIRTCVVAIAVSWIWILAVAGIPIPAHGTVVTGPRDPQLKRWSPHDRRVAARAAVAAELDRVDRAVAAGDLRTARKLLERLDQALPDNATVANNLGAVLAAIGRPREALAAFRRANDRDPDDAAAIIHVGRALLLSHELEEADRRLARWHDRVEDVPAVGFLIARVRRAQGRMDEARAIARRIARSPRVDSEAVFDAGNLLRDLADARAAEEAFRRAAALEPDLMGAWLSVLDIMLAGKRHEDGDRLSAELLRRFPDHRGLLVYRVLFLARSGKRAIAAQHLEQLRALPSSGPELGHLVRQAEEAVPWAPQTAPGPAPGETWPGDELHPAEVPASDLRAAVERTRDARPVLDWLVWDGVARQADEPVRAVTFHVNGQAPGARGATDESRVAIEIHLGEHAWPDGRRPRALAHDPHHPGVTLAGAEALRRHLDAALPGTPFALGLRKLSSGRQEFLEFVAVGRPHPRVWLKMAGRLDGRPGPEAIVRAAADLARRTVAEPALTVLDACGALSTAWSLRGAFAQLQAPSPAAGDNRVVVDLLVRPDLETAIERGRDFMRIGGRPDSRPELFHTSIGGLPATVARSGYFDPRVKMIAVGVQAGRYQIVLTDWTMTGPGAVLEAARRAVPQTFPARPAPGGR